MDKCDARTRTYKNGKTFKECEEFADFMNVERALELVENRLKLCTKGIEELKQIQSTVVGSVVQDVTRIPLEMLENEIEDLQEIKKELS